MQIIPLLLSESCHPYRRQIEYACDEIAVRIGRRLKVALNEDEEPAGLYYGPQGSGTALPHVVFDARSFETNSVAHAVQSGGEVYWSTAGKTFDSIDHIGSVFRLLNFLDEAAVREEDRDDRGIFEVAALPEARRATTTETMVDNHAWALAGLLNVSREQAPPIWPDNKSMAMLVTHDTDLAALRAPREVLYNLGKAFLRRDREFLELASLGLRSTGPADQDPGFGFRAWLEFEDARQMKSCFFLATRETARMALNDVRSSVLDDEHQLNFLRNMARNGFEFGLHASIHAKDNLDEFILAKRRIEDLLETPIWGVRHHYWSIDWRQPYLTYRKHLNAGFRYDCSIAWRDSAGFRTGTSLPFRPFDPGRGKAQRLYLLPTTIMDGHLTSTMGGNGAKDDLIKDIIGKIRRASGILCLDWHTEYAAPAFAKREIVGSLQRVLDAVGADAWFTTPKELVTHWHKRYRRILGEGFYQR